jgi:hypothetical protein
LLRRIHSGLPVHRGAYPGIGGPVNPNHHPLGIFCETQTAPREATRNTSSTASIHSWGTSRRNDPLSSRHEYCAPADNKAPNAPQNLCMVMFRRSVARGWLRPEPRLAVKELIVHRHICDARANHSLPFIPDNNGLRLVIHSKWPWLA